MIPASSKGPSLPSVLIADDQPAFRELLRQMLVGMAREIIECASGSEAVAAFEEHRPDWTLLDWAMPNLDGLAAARAIRARHPQARIVILSAQFPPALAREAESAGASGCFPKERLHEVLALLRLPPAEANSISMSPHQTRSS